MELAKQQVAAYWSAETYIALVGFVERIFAMCLHVSLSMMVLFAIAKNKPIWFWIALLWHALVDAVAVYAIKHVSVLAVEGIVAVLAVISLVIALRLRSMFSENMAESPLEPEVASL